MADEVVEPGAPEATETEVPAAEDTGQELSVEDYKKMVSELRDENAKRRVAAKDYAVFEEETTKPFLAAAQALAAGQTDEVSAWMVRNAAAVLGVEPDMLLALAEGGDDDGDDGEEEPGGFTPEQLQEMMSQMLDERLSQERTSSEVSAIQAEAESLGYKVGSRDYQDLLWLTMNETEGDMAAAHAKRLADVQGVINGYLEEKRAASAPRQVSGQAPGTERKITNFDQARAAAEEWMEANA